jgi:hypothetical protein
MNHSFLINDRIALGAFDFDGNILAPNSWCYVINIETGEEERVVAHYLDQNPNLLGWPKPKYKLHLNTDHSFAHFRDFSRRVEHIGADHLIGDIRDALEQKLFAPSFQSFKETFLIPARFFGIITARGHSAENLARAMSVINEATLSDPEKAMQYENIQYLWELFWKKWIPWREEALDFYFQEIGMYYGVWSSHLRNMISIDHTMPSAERKTHAMAHFIAHTKKLISKIESLRDKSLTIGFSDDAIWNSEAMIRFFVNERGNDSLIRSDDKLRVYFTGDQDQLCIIPDNGISIEKKGELTKIVI